MSRKASRNRRLMDLLPGEQSWGELLGLLATTFDCEAQFFETDFLPSLLRLGSWDDSGWVTRVKLENALAALEGSWVAVDHRRYRGRPRSLRVELRPGIGERGAVLHAKVTVLVYERAVRVIVGSANLTTTGYRENREVVCSLLATDSTPEHVELALQATAGMREQLIPWWSPTAERILQLAETKLAKWPRSASSSRFVWSDARRPLWEQLVDAWPSGEALSSIVVVSPFWSDEGRDGPLGRLVPALRARGKLPDLLPVHLLTEATPDADGWRPKLPGLGSFRPEELGVRITAQAVQPLPSDDGQQAVRKARRLHAKVVLLEGPTRSLAYCGSGNFTARGFGCDGLRANIEAGVFIVGASAQLVGSIVPPRTGPVIELTGHNTPPTGESEEADGAVPTFLQGAWLEPVPGATEQLRLRVEVDPRSVHGAFVVRRLGGPVLVKGQPGGPAVETVPLDAESLNALVRDHEVAVDWWESAQPANYPLNVEFGARATLPIAPGSGDPTESLLLAYYQGRVRYEDMFPPPPGWEDEEENAAGGVVPIESSVDTSRIQSYQVRAFVEALEGLRQDLTRAAAATESAITRAVLGPVSPIALAREVIRHEQAGKRTPMAAGFELVEIATCLVEAREVPVQNPAFPIVLDKGVEIVRELVTGLIARHPSLRDRGSPFPAFAQTVLTTRPSAEEQ